MWLAVLGLGGAAAAYFLFGKKKEDQAPPGRGGYQQPPAPPPAGGGGYQQPPAPPPRNPPAGAKRPVDLERVEAAKIVAEALWKDLQEKGMNYNRVLMKDFQRSANIQVDGIYGPQTHGALTWYLDGSGKVAPAPYAKGPKPAPYLPPTK